MPPASDRRGEPALEDLGKAFKAVATYIEDEKETRQKEFHDLIVKIEQTYPGRPTWDKDFIEMALQFQWPIWAVRSLPHLYVVVERFADGRVMAYLWQYVLSCIPDRLHYEAADIVPGELFRVVMDKDTAEFVHCLAPRLENTRLKNPYYSERATIGGIAHELNWAKDEKSGSSAAYVQDFEQAKEWILRKAGVLNLAATRAA
jgi:hypothetical protein